MSFAGQRQYENFEANEMSTKYIKFLTPSDSAVSHHRTLLMCQPPQYYEFLKPSTKLGMQIARSIRAVSKILDWLVK